MRAYLANGLFSEADQLYNELLAKEIRRTLPGIDLYVPQENPALNDKSGYADAVTIFEGDNIHLDRANLLIAVLDGIEIDSGVAAEVGRYLSLKAFQSDAKHIIGLYTDVRQEGRDNPQKVQALIEDGTENQFMYRNLYVIGGIKKHGKIVSSMAELLEELRKFK